MEIFRNKEECCGCSACASVCPIGCIKMESDSEGFLYPIIDNDKCISCGKCVNVCPMKKAESLKCVGKPEAYALYHLNNDILQQSTSGGAFSAISEAFCKDNYIIFGAAFDKNFIVRHCCVEDINYLHTLRQSKYVQSIIGNSYLKVQESIKDNKNVIFSGTPCQIAGLKSYLNNDYSRLLTIEIICHGVPSPKVFDLYLKSMKSKYKSDIKSIVFRDKSKGWEPHNVVIQFVSGKRYSIPGIDDVYEAGFYRNLVMRPSCYSCPFATVPRVADFTIGDFWGVEKIMPHLDNNKGLSVVLINTEKSSKLLKEIKKIAYVEVTDLEQVIKYNTQLAKPSEANILRESYMEDLQYKSFEEMVNIYLKPRPFINRIATKFFNKKTKKVIKSILKR